MIRMKARVAFPEKAQLGEGPMWHEGTLFWVDILKGRLLSSANDRTAELRNFERPVSAVFPREQGGYALLVDDRVVLTDSQLETTHEVVVLSENSDLRLSDGAVGASGELWFGSMRHDMQPGGSIYRLRSSDEEPQVIKTDLGMPNGMAFAPDFSALYFVDSLQQSITVFDYDADTSEISNPQILAIVEESMGTPDGIAVDSLGSVWVAHWSGGCVRRLELDGSWSQEVLVPTVNASSCVFGGADLKTLFITTAAVDLNKEELESQTAPGSIFSLTLPVGGVKQQEATL